MPLLPLPPGGAFIGAGDLPIVDEASIAALEPHLVNDSDSAPVRDAIRTALAAMFTRYQDATAEAAAQSNVLFATGIYLDGLGRDEGVFRQTSEPYTQAGDAAYRARIILEGGTVTPDAICAAVNAILAPYSAVKCRYLESILDRGFCRTSTAASPYVAFVRDGVTVGNVNPTYPDRLYVDDAAANGGASLANRGPGGFFCFGDVVGRFFVLRIPVLSLLDVSGAFGNDGTTAAANMSGGNNYGIFCGNGSVTPQTWWDFFRAAPATSTGVYQTIVNVVNRLIGHSIRWELLPDPLLV